MISKTFRIGAMKSEAAAKRKLVILGIVNLVFLVGCGAAR